MATATKTMTTKTATRGSTAATPPASPAPDQMLALAFVEDDQLPTGMQFYTFDCYKGTSWAYPGPSPWPAGVTSPPTISSLAPTLAASPQNFWGAFIDTSNNVNVCHSTDPLGATWSKPTVAQWGSPATNLQTGQPVGLAWFRNKLWMALQGWQSSRIFVTSSSDGVTWSAPTNVGDPSQPNGPAQTAYAPVLTVFNDQLWIAYNGANDQPKPGYYDIWLASCATPGDANSWAGQHVTVANLNNRTVASNAAPGFAAFNGQLYLALMEPNGNLPVFNSDKTGQNWTQNNTLSQHLQAQCAPALAVVYDQSATQYCLVLAYVMPPPTDGIYVLYTDGQQPFALGADSVGHQLPPNQQQPNQGTKVAPALAASLEMTTNVCPTYLVLGVQYAPPGGTCSNSNYDQQSVVVYTSSYACSTTTSISSSFSDSLGLTVTAGSDDFGGQVQEGVIATPTAQGDSSVTVSTAVSLTTRLTNRQPNVNGIDHDSDVFLIWINPMLTVSQGFTSKTLSYVLGSNDPGGSTAQAEVVPLNVAQAKAAANYTFDPASQPPPPPVDPAYGTGWPQNWQILCNAGLQQSDYVNILTSNPFAQNPNAAIDKNRFVTVLKQLIDYSPSDDPPDQVDLTNQNAQTTGQATSLDITVNISWSTDIPDVIKGEFTDSITWTTTSATSVTKENTQTASLSLCWPNGLYHGVPFLNVYWDTAYNTFMFALQAQN